MSSSPNVSSIPQYTHRLVGWAGNRTLLAGPFADFAGHASAPLGLRAGHLDAVPRALQRPLAGEAVVLLRRDIEVDDLLLPGLGSLKTGPESHQQDKQQRAKRAGSHGHSLAGKTGIPNLAGCGAG